MQIVKSTVIAFLLAIGITVIGGERAVGQWLPLTAKTAESRTIRKPDGSQVHMTVEGVLYRASNGDQLEHFQIRQNGRVTEDVASLLDNRKFRVYRIDYVTKTVQEVKKFDGPRVPDAGIAESNRKLRQETVDGIDCSVLPVVLNGKTVGTMWKSNKYDIPIKSEYTVENSGSVMHVQSRTYDIRGRREPDKAAFVIDPSFKVLPPLVH